MAAFSQAVPNRLHAACMASIRPSVENVVLFPEESFRLIQMTENARDVAAIDINGRVHPFEGSGQTWHYHKEMELVVVTDGLATRFIGGDIDISLANDVVLMGAHIPHQWRPNPMVSGYVLQFDVCAGSLLWRLPEVRALRPLWHNARLGTGFSGRTAREVVRLVRAMPDQIGVRRVSLFMDIIGVLAQAPAREVRLLSAQPFLPPGDAGLQKGIQKAVQAVLDGFHTEMQLEDVVRQAGTSRATFQRHFRKHTGKSFTAFLSEIRLDQARRQLLETDLSISEIAFAVGFNSLSHFNHRFSQAHQESPRAFRTRMRQPGGSGRAVGDLPPREFPASRIA